MLQYCEPCYWQAGGLQECFVSETLHSAAGRRTPAWWQGAGGREPCTGCLTASGMDGCAREITACLASALRHCSCSKSSKSSLCLSEASTQGSLMQGRAFCVCTDTHGAPSQQSLSRDACALCKSPAKAICGDALICNVQCVHP